MFLWHQKVISIQMFMKWKWVWGPSEIWSLADRDACKGDQTLDVKNPFKVPFCHLLRLNNPSATSSMHPPSNWVHLSANQNFLSIIMIKLNNAFCTTRQDSGGWGRSTRLGVRASLEISVTLLSHKPLTHDDCVSSVSTNSSALYKYHLQESFKLSKLTSVSQRIL